VFSVILVLKLNSIMNINKLMSAFHVSVLLLSKNFI